MNDQERKLAARTLNGIRKEAISDAARYALYGGAAGAGAGGLGLGLSAWMRGRRLKNILHQALGGALLGGGAGAAAGLGAQQLGEFFEAERQGKKSEKPPPTFGRAMARTLFGTGGEAGGSIVDQINDFLAETMGQATGVDVPRGAGAAAGVTGLGAATLGLRQLDKYDPAARAKAIGEALKQIEVLGKKATGLDKVRLAQQRKILTRMAATGQSAQEAARVLGVENFWNRMAALRRAGKGLPKEPYLAHRKIQKFMRGAGRAAGGRIRVPWGSAAKGTAAGAVAMALLTLLLGSREK